MKQSELIIKEIELINPNECHVILKDDEIVYVYGELVDKEDDDSNYLASGIKTKIEDIFFDNDKLLPMFEIDESLYNDEKVQWNVKTALAGAITEFCEYTRYSKREFATVSDYTPETEIDENGVKWRLPPSTKFVNKILPFELKIAHLKKMIPTYKDEKDREAFIDIIDMLSKDHDDSIMPTEVSINSSDKDGDIFIFPDEDEASDINNLTDSREKVSMDELSSEKVMNCSAASNDISDAPHGDKKADLSYTLK